MNIFNQIQLKRPKHSWFDISYDHKLSLKMGKLVPFHVQECIPGDKFKMSAEAMFRLMPMISPIMHKVDIFMHYFFVPNRILWDNWEKFITGGNNGTDLPPAFPTIAPNSLGTVAASTLPDYLGLPLGNYTSLSDTQISAMPFAAYQRIWFEYYRDQNLQETEVDPPYLVDGDQPLPMPVDLLELRTRAWEHDYFTSALPFAQKGDAVDIPIDVAGNIDITSHPGQQTVKRSSDGSNASAGQLISDSGAGLDVSGMTPSPNAYIDVSGTLDAELDELTGTTTIEDLRAAMSLQKWLEKNARAGSRYVESILAHFGVRSSDKRLQRPEYLGGVKSSMAISEVLQTSQSSDTPQGNMAGHGISVAGGKNIKFFCEEHGTIIGIVSVRPKTAYFQGLPKHFSKFDRMEYFWPDFAFLGEQPILNQELYMQLPGAPGPTQNGATFGYIPRYTEYRYNPSRVSGAMKTSLDFWHLGRKFANLPTLSEEFIMCNPSNRIFAVEDPEEDTIVAHIYQKIMARRPIPKYGNPGSL